MITPRPPAPCLADTHQVQSVETSFPPPERCFSCDVLAGLTEVPGGGPIWQNATVMVNHHEDPKSDKAYADSRAGWFIICPIRHVTRIYDLSSEEWNTIGEVARTVDSALTHLYSSRRTLVASLGWFTNDHIHFHCVPTFGAEVSFGSLNFDGAYTPVPLSSNQVAESVGHYLHANLLARSQA